MRKILVVVLALFMTFSCFACGGNTTQTAGEEAADGGATDKLVVWSYMNEGEPIAIWQQSVVEEYQEAYPDVEVELVFCGRDILSQFQSKLNDKDAADFPDLISQKDGTLAPLASDGLLVPLDEYLSAETAYDQDVTWGDTFVPKLMECMSVDGKNYFIPEGLYTHGFFYDANLFSELGIKVPETWDEFVIACDTLKANGIAPIALDGTVDDYNDWWYCRFAERLAGTEALCQAAAGEITFSSNPALLKAAEYIQSVVDAGYFQDGAAGSVFPSAQALFVQGEAGMLFCGAWIPTEMESQTPDTMDMKMFALPILPDSASETHEEMWANCFALTADAKNETNAINFLKVFSSMGVQQSKSDLKNPSPLIDGPTVAELDTIETIVSNATSTSTIYGGTATYSEWYTKVFGPTCTKLITGVLSAEEFIAELDSLTTAFYAD
jgi:raffinose/stachyose/melibiose transport system substrate-binding protein